MSDPNFLPNATETIQFEHQNQSDVTKTDSLATGTRLGHYIIKKYIGGGGMGRVYLATDTALDRDVAIKLLPQQLTKNPAMVARFMNEAKSAARLNHEHIAQVYFAGEESGIPFIAFEYVEGINLRTMVEDNDVFPLPQSLNFLLQIAHALAHAATHNVVHRDVKPSNILITKEGRAKLIDMGLARLLDTSRAREDLTESGVTLGTFDYISPEQARDPRNADIRSDIYSLGCTFFYMLAGRPPFPEGTVLQKLLQHQGDAPPDIRSFQPEIPAEISFLIQKMMAKDPKQRFQTPTVLIEALTDVALRLGLQQTSSGNLVWSPRQTSSRSVFLRYVPAAAAVSLLLFGFLLMSLFSEQFYEPLRLPEPLPPFVQTVPSAPDVPDVPVEPTPSSSVPFAVVFRPPNRPAHDVPQSGALRPPRIGGHIRPALYSVEQPKDPFRPLYGGVSAGGRLSLADITPASPGTATQLSPAFANIRCIDPLGIVPGSYPTLAAALSDAPNNTTFELRWDGVRQINDPIRFDQRNIRFAAAEGFAPTMLFEPSDLYDSRSVFTLFSSAVQFENVALEFRLNPRVLATHWSLFELSGNTQLTFNQCSLTIRNRSLIDDSVNHDDVVFFRNGLASGGAEGAYTTDESFMEPVSITLTSTLLRGEAAAIESKVTQDIIIECTNSIIALAKPFLQTEETRRATRQTMIKMQWNRVAFFGIQGLVVWRKELTDMPMMIEFAAQDSVFVLNRSPLVFFRGSRNQEATLGNFVWMGGENNYFQYVSGLRFRTPSSLLEAGMTYEMPLREWRDDYWPSAMQSQIQIDVLPLNEVVKPMSRYLPRDVRLLYPIERVVLPDFVWFPTWWNSE